MESEYDQHQAQQQNTAKQDLVDEETSTEISPSCRGQQTVEKVVYKQQWADKRNSFAFRTGQKKPRYQRSWSLQEASNWYRHRRSLTDTYLGTEIADSDSSDGEKVAALMRLVSETRPVRKVIQRHRSFSQRLMFGREGSDSDNGGVAGT